MPRLNCCQRLLEVALLVVGRPDPSVDPHPGVAARPALVHDQRAEIDEARLAAALRELRGAGGVAGSALGRPRLLGEARASSARAARARSFPGSWSTTRLIDRARLVGGAALDERIGQRQIRLEQRGLLPLR